MALANMTTPRMGVLGFQSWFYFLFQLPTNTLSEIWQVMAQAFASMLETQMELLAPHFGLS